jgi:hypothetical protein
VTHSFSFISAAMLLAAKEPVGDLGEFRLKDLPDIGPYELLVLSSLTVLVVIAMVWRRVSRRRRDFDYNSPPRLFSELCRAHKLTWSSRRLLKQLAAARDLKSAATLFVEPDYFDVTNLPHALKPSARELRELRHMLFD